MDGRVCVCVCLEGKLYAHFNSQVPLLRDQSLKKKILVDRGKDYLDLRF